MITESILLILIIYFYKNNDKLLLRYKWNKINNSDNRFKNSLGKSLKLYKIEKLPYGYYLTIELPYSYTRKCLERDLDIFMEALHFSSIEISQKNNIFFLKCITNYSLQIYDPIKLPANKILIADGYSSPIIVDMNEFPHMLLGGDTGTGKSRILLLLITNLIKFCDDVDIYLLQVRKNDLGVFKKCKQVKANATSLEEVVTILKNLENICFYREKLIDNIKGYYNISDYNKCNPPLKYIYVIIEEFSFINKSSGDDKKEKDLKNQALKLLKNIVNVGRSSGVFLITALQKPTNDSIPSNIKSQLCTRVSLLIKDPASARVILNNENNTHLKKREVIVRTLEEQKGVSYTIDHNIIMQNIKHKIVNKTQESYTPKTIKNKLSSNIDPGINNLIEVLKKI